MLTDTTTSILRSRKIALKSISFSQKRPKVVLRHFNVTYVNPFNTLRSCKIRLFQRQNRGIVIKDTRHNEISILGQYLKCWSAGVMLGFHWHQVWFVSLPPDGHYTRWKVPFTLEFLENYLKSVTLIVTCVRDFTDWNLIWCHVGGTCDPLLFWPWDDSRV